MTTPPNGRRSPFEVTASEAIKQAIRDLHVKAAQRGHGKQFLNALRRIHDGLRNDPNNFGDPLFRLASLKLLVFHVVVWRVVVHYGVHEEKPLVVLRYVNLLN
jgi:hypothetical protein